MSRSSNSVSSDPISPEGRRHIEAEIHRLVTVERPDIVRSVSETARAHGMGDISAAKRQLVDFDARISRLQDRLRRTIVVDPGHPANPTVVGFGARVHCRTEKGEDLIVILLGADEVDPRSNRISWNAPVARALKGTSVGAEVDIETPSGEMMLQVMEISYPIT